MKISISLLVLLIGITAAQERSISGSSSRRNRFSASKPHALNFNCPEDFGYYTHPDDCSMYYVCVFGGALLESCSGGLMYSNDLQTCDWPRNVVCNPSHGPGVSTVKVTDPRTSSRANQVRSATESLTSSASLSRGLDNTIRVREPLKSSGSSKSIFDDPSSTLRQGRFVFDQRPTKQNTNSEFQAQETSSRSFNVIASSPTPKVVFPSKKSNKKKWNRQKRDTSYEQHNPSFYDREFHDISLPVTALISAGTRERAVRQTYRDNFSVNPRHFIDEEESYSHSQPRENYLEQTPFISHLKNNNRIPPEPYSPLPNFETRPFAQFPLQDHNPPTSTHFDNQYHTNGYRDDRPTHQQRPLRIPGPIKKNHFSMSFLRPFQETQTIEEDYRHRKEPFRIYEKSQIFPQEPSFYHEKSQEQPQESSFYHERPKNHNEDSSYYQERQKEHQDEPSYHNEKPSRHKPEPAKSTFSFSFGFNNDKSTSDKQQNQPYSPNNERSPVLRPRFPELKPKPFFNTLPHRPWSANYEHDNRDKEFVPPPIAGAVPLSKPELISFQDLKSHTELDEIEPYIVQSNPPEKEKEYYNDKLRPRIINDKQSVKVNSLPRPTMQPVIKTTENTNSIDKVPGLRKGAIRPSFPKFKPRTKNRNRESNVPQIPGTARQPELSRIPSGSIKNRDRPLLPGASSSNRFAATPAPKPQAPNQGFINDLLNLNDTDYYYYYDDILYDDYYDPVSKPTTLRPASVRSSSRSRVSNPPSTNSVSSSPSIDSSSTRRRGSSSRSSVLSTNSLHPSPASSSTSFTGTPTGTSSKSRGGSRAKDTKKSTSTKSSSSRHQTNRHPSLASQNPDSTSHDSPSPDTLSLSSSNFTRKHENISTLGKTNHTFSEVNKDDNLDEDKKVLTQSISEPNERSTFSRHISGSSTPIDEELLVSDDINAITVEPVKQIRRVKIRTKKLNLVDQNADDIELSFSQPRPVFSRRNATTSRPIIPHDQNETENLIPSNNSFGRIIQSAFSKSNIKSPLATITVDSLKKRARSTNDDFIISKSVSTSRHFNVPVRLGHKNQVEQSPKLPFLFSNRRQVQVPTPKRINSPSNEESLKSIPTELNTDRNRKISTPVPQRVNVSPINNFDINTHSKNVNRDRVKPKPRLILKETNVPSNEKIEPKRRINLQSGVGSRTSVTQLNSKVHDKKIKTTTLQYPESTTTARSLMPSELRNIMMKRLRSNKAKVPRINQRISTTSDSISPPVTFKSRVRQPFEFHRSVKTKKLSTSSTTVKSVSRTSSTTGKPVSRTSSTTKLVSRTPETTKSVSSTTEETKSVSIAVETTKSVPSTTETTKSAPSTTETTKSVPSITETTKAVPKTTITTKSVPSTTKSTKMVSSTTKTTIYIPSTPDALEVDTTESSVTNASTSTPLNILTTKEALSKNLSSTVPPISSSSTSAKELIQPVKMSSSQKIATSRLSQPAIIWPSLSKITGRTIASRSSILSNLNRKNVQSNAKAISISQKNSNGNANNRKRGFATITVAQLRAANNLKNASPLSGSLFNTTQFSKPRTVLKPVFTPRRPSPFSQNKSPSPIRLFTTEQKNTKDSTSSKTSLPTGPHRGSSQSASRTSAGAGSPETIGRAPQRLIRPSKKPRPSSGNGLITDIWKYPARRPSPVRPQPPFDTPATKCDPTVCQLPDCYCGQAPVPGNIAPQNVPQLVLLTFDDSVNDLNKKLYVELFEKGRVNPNGCPISATFYVSHEWTDYSQVQNLYSDGHEIASHSITHSFGEQFSTSKWAKEIGGQREIMSAYGGVRMEDIRGMRAPFLAIGGNNMFRMLHELNFTYDSSMPVYENRPPSWPYTLDYKIFHDCMIPPCPTNSYPGVWQVPMVMWQDLTGGRCSMADACTTPGDAEGVYQMLIKNFERHYTTNRSPFGLYYHAAWFTTAHHKEGFIAFLDTISAMDDVWLTTSWQSLEWVRDPVPLSQAKSFKPFQCDYPERPPRCSHPRVCNVWHKGSVRYLKTCQRCPESYPWTGNTGVQSPLNDV